MATSMRCRIKDLDLSYHISTWAAKEKNRPLEGLKHFTSMVGLYHRAAAAEAKKGKGKTVDIVIINEVEEPVQPAKGKKGKSKEKKKTKVSIHYFYHCDNQ
jgi:hypothetical protein